MWADRKKRKLYNTVCLFSRLAKLLAPLPKKTISEWADENRWLAGDVSSVPGRWRTDYTPYLREIQDTISSPETERVVIMSAARAGKTSVLLNAIGYYIHYDPSLMMAVLPTFDVGERFSKKQLALMIRDTPVLRERVAEEKSRDSANTLLLKTFPGGSLQIAGANSPNSLRADTIKILVFDEVDGAPSSAGKEGDPVKLSERRTMTYIGRGRKIVLTSTPTNKGASRIEQAYNQSSMEQWCLPCPSCGKLQPLMWAQLDFETIKHRCHECDTLHDKDEWISGEGKWIARNPDSEVRGFHMNALCSPFVRWEELIKEWQEAVQLSNVGNHAQLKVFINTVLGETWEETGEIIEQSELMDRREEYFAEVPDGVCAITAGIDTQDNRLCIELVGWGASEKESWGLGYFELWGDPRMQGSLVWSQLDDILRKPLRYANGMAVPIVCACIDMGGHAADQVATYAKLRQGWNVWAIRGVGGFGKRFVDPSQTFRTKVASATGFHLGVDAGKEEMAARLRIKIPGSGFCHFPRGGRVDVTGAYETERGYDERYFVGLTAEKRMLILDNKGFKKYEWQKDPGKANEPFDCRNYAGAALILSRIDLDKIAGNVPWEAGAVTPKPKKAPIKNNRRASNFGSQSVRGVQNAPNGYTAV